MGLALPTRRKAISVQSANLFVWRILRRCTRYVSKSCPAVALAMLATVTEHALTLASVNVPTVGSRHSEANNVPQVVLIRIYRATLKRARVWTSEARCNAYAGPAYMARIVKTLAQAKSRHALDMVRVHTQTLVIWSVRAMFIIQIQAATKDVQANSLIQQVVLGMATASLKTTKLLANASALGPAMLAHAKSDSLVRDMVNVLTTALAHVLTTREILKPIGRVNRAKGAKNTGLAQIVICDAMQTKSIPPATTQ